MCTMIELSRDKRRTAIILDFTDCSKETAPNHNY